MGLEAREGHADDRRTVVLGQIVRKRVDAVVDEDCD